MIPKAEHLDKGPNPRFVAASLSSQAADAPALYEDVSCAPGDMELLIKEEKQNLGPGAYRVLRYRAVGRHLHLVDCAYACLTHVGLQAQRAQGRKDAKNVLRLPPIRQLK